MQQQMFTKNADFLNLFVIINKINWIYYILLITYINDYIKLKLYKV